MAQQDFSSKIGSSPSKVVNSVIQNSKNGQRTFPPNGSGDYNKQPVKNPGK